MEVTGHVGSEGGRDEAAIHTARGYVAGETAIGNNIYIYIIILYLYPRVHRIHWRHFSTDEFYDRFFNAIFFHFFFYIASVDVLERIYSEGRETLNRVTLYQRIRGY